MRLSLWALMCAAGLLATPAEAREHELHPVASGAEVSGILTLTPREIDVSRPDWTMIVELRNDTDLWLVIPIQGARCVRGDLETLVDGPSRPLLLAPWQAKDVKLRCDHGRWVTGDFGLVLPQIAASTTGDRRAPDRILAEQVTWQMQEGDVSRRRQREAEGSLARLSYCLPTPPPDTGLPPTATLSPR